MALVQSREQIWIANRVDLELVEGTPIVDLDVPSPFPTVVWLRLEHTREEFVRVGYVFEPWPKIAYAVYVGPGNVLMKVLP